MAIAGCYELQQNLAWRLAWGRVRRTQQDSGIMTWRKQETILPPNQQGKDNHGGKNLLLIKTVNSYDPAPLYSYIYIVWEPAFPV